ncbi:TPA: 4-hydroxybenzoate octaprenyltransferase [Pseudomonas aeruginosa]|nr:4-hydroxybenzoate octaprenyltransferase [Pseudomonas aeruginosa]HBN9885763.1 4-hydroxybenzoate octaprenyltransferase [Pseudomonas aeruginosa]
MGRSDLTDIHAGDWVDHRLPFAWRPFARLARLDRPVGTWLTLFPCWAALIQASNGIPDLWILGIFSLGALLMRSAGSTINDIADRKFDCHVERTRFRPLTSGQTTLTRAVIFLVVQIALAGSLLHWLNAYTRGVAVAVVPLVFLYPFCKRFTHWPQVVLGASFNWGMLMAWSAVANRIPAGATLMWVGAIAWQVGYDTIYAYVDAKDDTRLGLKSTAVLFGRYGRVCIGGFYVLAIGAWLIGGRLLGMSIFFTIGVLVIAVHLAWQTWRVDIDRPAMNFRLFNANIFTGMLLTCSALAGVNLW